METDLGDLVAAIGWIAVESARIEYVAGQLEAALIGTPRAIPVVMGQSWGAIKEGIVALIVEGRVPYLDEGPEVDRYMAIKAVVQRAGVLMEQRSKVIHAVWEPALRIEDGPRALRVKRWGKSDSTYWTADRLADLRGEMRAVHAELEAAFEEQAAIAEREGGKG